MFRIKCKNDQELQQLDHLDYTTVVKSSAKIGKREEGPRRSSITGFPELAAVRQCSSVNRMRAGYAIECTKAIHSGCCEALKAASSHPISLEVMIFCPLLGNVFLSLFP